MGVCSCHRQFNRRSDDDARVTGSLKSYAGGPDSRRAAANDRRHDLQPLAVQACLLLTLALLAAFFLINLVNNVERLNLHLGFGFLSRTAGFEIAQTPIPYPVDATYFRAFVVAFLNTVLISAIAIVCATILGFFVALARLSSNPLLSGVALAYVEAIRNIPLLLQLFTWYFAVLGPLPLPRDSLSLFGLVFLNKRGLSFPAPMAQPGLPLFAGVAVLSLAAAIQLLRRAKRHRVDTGQTSRKFWIAGLVCLGLPLAVAALAGPPVSWDVPRPGSLNISGGASLIPEFVAMAVGMSVYGSAFIAEIIRGGIATVRRGQTEAGLALGLSCRKIYTHIVIPQAMRAVVPPLCGQYISLLKNSSLAAAIGYPDLMLIFAGTALNQTGQPLETMGMTMASYLLLSLGVSSIANVVNRRMQLVER